MLSLLFAAALAGEPPRVLLLDLKPQGISAEVARTITGVVSGRLGQAGGIVALSTGDLQALADLEATKQSAGCDVSGCLAEVAAALGARFVIFGDVGALGDDVVVNLNLYDAERAVPVARKSPRAPAARIAAVVEPAVDELVVALGGVPAAAATTGNSWLPVGAGIAAVGLVGAGVAGAVALWADGTVATGTADRQAKEDALGTGRIALAGVAVGVVVGIAGGGVAVLGVLE